MVTSERYTEVLMNSITKGCRWDLPVEPLEVGVLHGAIRLMLLHPEVEQNYGQDFKTIADGLRTWCLNCFRDMGFTEEEVRELDTRLI